MTRIAQQGGPLETPDSAPTDYVGRVIDERYQILRRLGSGGMGTVVLARHTGLKRLVAIKFLEPAHLSESGATQRLFREAQAAAAIGHPNIIDVLDVGVAPWGDPYLVMEYLEGEDLATLTELDGSLTAPQACWVLDQILHGLAAAHELGIIHRDLKPQNVVVARKRSELVVKVIDFGIAKILEPDVSPITRSGELVGTPSFMSPEQAKGEDVDARSDIFSVGLLFHRLLTGKNAFSATNYHSLIHRIATGEPDLTDEALTPDVRAFIAGCLEKEPAKRFQNVPEVLAALRTLSAWSERAQGQQSLSTRIRAVEVAPTTVVDRSATPTRAERGQPAWVPPATPAASPAPPPMAEPLEPTLAASTPGGKSQLPVSARVSPKRQLWWALAALVSIAFGGGWWAANRNTSAPSIEGVPGVASHPTTDIRIARDTVVKLYQASPANSTSNDTNSTSSATTLASGGAPSRPPGAKPAPNAPGSPNPAAAAKPSNTLGRTGKNSFFSEVFE